jgi:hypothetical protein
VILRTHVVGACAAIALLVASPAVALPYNNLIGTTPNPAQGYYAGRFSNGPVAANVLNHASGDNYAWGGARARNDGVSVPDLAAQVTSYLTLVGGVGDPNALFLINADGNDVFDILSGADAATTIAAAVTAIVTQISVLQAAGAQYFLDAGVGSVGGTPSAISAGAFAQAAGYAASQAITNAIFAAVPGGIATFNVIALSAQVNADPTAWGLPAGINNTTACLGSGVPVPGGPPTCNESHSSTRFTRPSLR